MLIFWAIATGLILLALAFVIPPLLKTNTSVTDIDHNTVNVAIYKERLHELEQENLLPEQLAQAKQELKKTLAQELDNSAILTTPHSPNCWVGVIVAFCLPILAMGGYLTLGEPKFFMSPLAQFGDNPQILSDFAEFFGTSDDERFAQLPNKLLETALRIDPNHQKALGLSAVRATQEGNYQAARIYWQRLLAQVPPEQEEIKQILQKRINDLQQLAKEDDATMASSATTATVKTEHPMEKGKTSIEVHVNLEPTLQNKVNPDDTLFIYATPTDSRMPLAVAKQFVQKLPNSATLDDSMAMMPNNKLSDFQEITIVARISRSGDAMRRSGDLEGKISPVILGKQDKVEVMINQIVP